jgi:hypothetical protein
MSVHKEQKQLVPIMETNCFEHTTDFSVVDGEKVMYSYQIAYKRKTAP